MRIAKIIQVPGLPIRRQPGPELPICDGTTHEDSPSASPLPLPEGFEFDPHDPPPMVEVTLGDVKEVQCRVHFLKRTRYEEGQYRNGFFFITALQTAPPDARCHDCVRGR